MIVNLILELSDSKVRRGEVKGKDGRIENKTREFLNCNNER